MTPPWFASDWRARYAAMSDLTDRIEALPKWPKEEDYSSQIRLASGIAVTYSYHADDFRLAQATVDAALARLALAREWIEESGHTISCAWRHTKLTSTSLWPPCDCGFIEILAALEEPHG